MKYKKNNQKDLTLSDRCYVKNYQGTDIVFVAIPKNGSTVLDQSICTKTSTREFDDYPNFRKKKFVVIIREPGARWISGAAEYLNRNKINFKNWNPYDIVFDPHTIPQFEYIAHINENLIEWHLLESLDFNQLHRKYTIFNRPVDQLHSNSVYTKENKKIDKYNRVKELFFKDIILQEKIRETYSLDYKLYNLLKSNKCKPIKKYPLDFFYNRGVTLNYNELLAPVTLTRFSNKDPEPDLP